MKLRSLLLLLTALSSILLLSSCGTIAHWLKMPAKVVRGTASVFGI